MKLIQMHERLRQVLLHRIQRGSLSVSLLTRQTGLAKAHISNFLHSKRTLSQAAMDRVLAAQQLEVEDLLISSARRGAALAEEDKFAVPLVSHEAALFERIIHPRSILATLPLLSDGLQLVDVNMSGRSLWQRLVAIRISTKDAEPMRPVIQPEAIAVIDRHYRSLTPRRTQWPSLYAVRKGAHLTVRYVEFSTGRLVLRPHNINFPSDVLEIEPERRPQELIAGCVVLIVNQA